MKLIRLLRVPTWQYSAVVVTVATLAILRIWNSINRLPPDPGIDFYVESRISGFDVILREEGGYLDVPRRILSLLIGSVSAEFWVFSGNLMWLGLMLACACGVFRTCRSITGSWIISSLCSITYVLSPAMSESQLGHESVVKWTLLLLLAIRVASMNFSDPISVPLVALIICSCLSNPVSFALLPILVAIQFRNLRWRNRVGWMYLLAFLAPLTFQFWTWWRSGQSIQKYGGATQYLPWDGMGLFWYFNWLSAPLFALALLGVEILSLVKRGSNFSTSLSQFRRALIISSILIWLVSYLIGGIADRYFVVPQTLVWIASLLCIPMKSTKHAFLSIQSLVGLGVSALLLFGTAKWFSASEFLNGSPKWSESVRNARRLCSAGDKQSVTIPQSINTVEIQCVLLD